MEQGEKYEELVAIIRPYLPEDIEESQINPDSHLVNELNINSAHLVDIVLDVEDKYDIILENEDMEKMQTVQEALEIIERKTSLN